MHRIRRAPGIRTKLLLSFVLVAMFTGALGLNVVITVDRLNASHDTLNADVVGDTRLLVDWLNQARVSEGDLSEFMFETDPAARAQLRADMALADARLTEIGARFDGSTTDINTTEDLTTLSQTWHVYADWRDQSILAPLEAGNFAQARAAFQTGGDVQSAAVDRAILAFLDTSSATATALDVSADVQGDLAVRIAVGLTAGAMLLALLIGFFLSRDIARAAGQVATAAKGLAVGDLDQQITVRSGDELGQMADAVRSMIAYQHEMAEVARAMAVGDLSQNVTPKGAADVLGIAFGKMTANLRTFVSDLQQQTALAEHERTTLASVLASMSDGLILMSEDGCVAFCNAPAAAMLGSSSETLTGKTGAEALALLRPFLQDPESVRETFRTPLAERPSYEMVFEGPPQRHLLMQRFSVGGNGPMGILLHDLTAERELVRAKDELVSMVSHELASPATSLVAYAGLLAQHNYSEPERQDMLATMVQEGQRLTAIIQDFLDIQRLEHGRFQITTRPTELRGLLEHAARIASTDAEHPLTVDLPTSLPLVQADPNRVQQVIANLLSNARKYTPAHGRIWLAARHIDGAIEISVADEGLGIPLEAQPHLFEKFYRVDADDRRLIKGTGLGLAIVKEIVEALGGTIGAESAGSGHGSRFWFTLPLAETASIGQERGDVERPPELVLLPSSSALRVLVVDDDAAIRSTVRRVLRPDGHQVTLVASAEEALELCRAQSFDVVLTDLGLGSGMDGWELAGCLQRDWPQVQVILASGRTGIDAAEAHTRGIAALLSKPYQPDDLRRLVVDIGHPTTPLAA